PESPRAAASSSAPSTRTPRSTRRSGCWAWSFGRHPRTTSSACVPMPSSSRTPRPSSPPSAPPRAHPSTRSPRSRTAARRPAPGRRFRSLKLWAVLRCYGREGLQQTIRDGVRLAELFESWVRDEPGWEVVAPRHFSLVCFRREANDAENEALLERVNATGEIFMSHTVLGGQYVLRLAVGNARTTEDDVRHAWDLLRREARRCGVA